ncbi:hypothetical protein SLV14_004496 [Streptomyces sp. Je 1-4]|uniref:hypothetical protein n=1 Tax=Streptomyces TaxID=1883 RepID=UPI0021DB73FF|nr:MULTISPECIES: hypothetical protein [unclassified Streptomyces]UYB41707.1 hypothetical protein SLV14_004496 [Streptomyces sp. Je 1-4]UZQ37965.1 hypothetical protein SLV14N_004496 [Streptomyces sp. Je 1-4] [Streptomyces sp. Je 1-4 4N24]UZQ45382.1 hypothetical protein SLV14NA_004496 [Streptomyces sp. Je 1-4] [Streptomyces sp. Je 1-4 4N24_ara]
MSRLVIGFGDDGKFRNDIQDQASESYTVTAGPNETVTVIDGQTQVTKDDDTN